MESFMEDKLDIFMENFIENLMEDRNKKFSRSFPLLYIILAFFSFTTSWESVKCSEYSGKILLANSRFIMDQPHLRSKVFNNLLKIYK